MGNGGGWNMCGVGGARRRRRGWEVCHTVALPFTLKSILKAKKKLWKFKYFSIQNIYNFQKNPFKRNQNPSRYHNFI